MKLTVGFPHLSFRDRLRSPRAGESRNGHPPEKTDAGEG